MHVPRAPHRWSVSPKEAIAIQRRLASRIRFVRPRRPLRLVAGVDAAFSSDGERCIGGVVLWDLLEERIVEEHSATRRLTFPYVPGLLTFREAPAILAALRKLELTPDALIFDGQGLAHPRRFGIACHVGVILDTVAVGCAKTRLVGQHTEPATRRGSRAALVDDGDVLGTVLRTQKGVKPVYVSVGHRIDLPSARRLVLECAVRYRLPEPTRLADQLVGRVKRGG